MAKLWQIEIDGLNKKRSRKRSPLYSPEKKPEEIAISLCFVCQWELESQSDDVCADPRASRGIHWTNPASGPIPHKLIPRSPLKNRAWILVTNPAPRQVQTGRARGQVKILPSLYGWLRWRMSLRMVIASFPPIGSMINFHLLGIYIINSTVEETFLSCTLLVKVVGEYSTQRKWFVCFERCDFLRHIFYFCGFASNSPYAPSSIIQVSPSPPQDHRLRSSTISTLLSLFELTMTLSEWWNIGRA